MGRSESVAIGVVLIAGSIVALQLLVWVPGSIALRRSEEALRKAGRPTKIEEVIPAPVPETNNAAPLYKQAYELLRRGHPTNSILSIVRDLPARPATPAALATNSSLEIFRVTLASPAAQEAMRLVEEGNARGAFRSDLDYNNMPRMALWHLGEMHDVLYFLRQKARCDALDGRHAEAWRTTLAALRFADALCREPILESQLVRVSLLWNAMDMMQWVAAYGIPSILYGELDTLVAAAEDRTPIVLGIDGERLLTGSWVFNQNPAIMAERSMSFGWSVPYPPPAGFGDYVKRGIRHGFGALWKPITRRDHAEFNRVMQAAAQSAGESSPPDTLGYEDIQASVPSYCILTRMLTPALDSVVDKHWRLVALARVSRAGLALLRARQETGAFPSSLQEAAKTLNVEDPYTSGLLAYRADGDRFILYSLGPDRRDDGGTSMAAVQHMTNATWDISWSFTGFVPGQRAR